MDKINLLRQLKKEGKLKIVESSDEIKQSYIKKSESNFESAKILLRNNKIEESFPLVYYSMYNLLLALLFKTGIKNENHSASIILLKEIFDIDNSAISAIKKERIEIQYYADFNIAKKDVGNAIGTATQFNETILDFISKLTLQKIQIHRNKFIKLIS